MGKRWSHEQAWYTQELKLSRVAWPCGWASWGVSVARQDKTVGGMEGLSGNGMWMGWGTSMQLSSSMLHNSLLKWRRVFISVTFKVLVGVAVDVGWPELLTHWAGQGGDTSAQAVNKRLVIARTAINHGHHMPCKLVVQTSMYLPNPLPNTQMHAWTKKLKTELMPFIKTRIFIYKHPCKKARCDICVFTVSSNMTPHLRHSCETNFFVFSV